MVTILTMRDDFILKFGLDIVDLINGVVQQFFFFSRVGS